MWWWIVGILVVIVIAVFVENRRGSTGRSKTEDRHRNGPDIRGGGGF